MQNLSLISHKSKISSSGQLEIAFLKSQTGTFKYLYTIPIIRTLTWMVYFPSGIKKN